MRSEREPNRYEPLNETHRRVAEEEEKRRLAEQEQARLSAQPEPEPVRPGPELRPTRSEITPDDPHSPKARLTEKERELQEQGREPRPSRPEIAPEHDPDSPEARLAAREQELQEQVRLGRIKPGEMIYQLRQFDNELHAEIEQGGRPALRDGSGAEFENVQAPERAADIRDQPTEQSRDDPNQRTPEARIEREAEAAEYEIVGRGEMSDARAARLERLRGIDRDIERENRENEGKGPNLGHEAGDHSR